MYLEIHYGIKEIGILVRHFCSFVPGIVTVWRDITHGVYPLIKGRFFFIALKSIQKLIYDYNILRETSLIRVKARIMDPSDPFGIDSDQNCLIIPKVSIVFCKENGIIPIGTHSEKFHNTCPEQVFMFVRSYLRSTLT